MWHLVSKEFEGPVFAALSEDSPEGNGERARKSDDVKRTRSKERKEGLRL